MPSVGMRRTTRVFGVVKGVDGARVLRSGRRLWPEPKLRRPNDGDDWYPHPHSVIKKHNGPGSGGLKPKTPNGWAHVQSIKQDEEEEEEEEEQVMETREEEDEVIEQVSKKVKEEEEEEEEQVVVSKDNMFGLVYSRKRKRNGGEAKKQDRMYGIRFSRRRRRRRLVGAFGVVFEGSCGGGGSSSGGFLSLVLGFMKKERVHLPELASFLLSQPISGVFASRGIHFLWVCL